MATLNRDALRNALVTSGPLAVITAMNRLGYVRGRFDNGLEVIATPDGGDWTMAPLSYVTMRLADKWHAQWKRLPVVDMGR